MRRREKDLALQALLSVALAASSALALELGMSKDPKHPGSWQLNRGRVGRVRQQVQCHSEGDWVLDNNPRPLPWDPLGLSNCDKVWLNTSTSHVAGPQADAITNASEWRVRDALKYRWKVPRRCEATWQEFDSWKFCAAVARTGGNMLFVGDSLTRNMFDSLRAHLSLKVPSRGSGFYQDRFTLEQTPVLAMPELCKEWEKSGAMSSYFRLCAMITSCSNHLGDQGAGDFSERPTLFHVRNDKLTAKSKHPITISKEHFLPWFELIKKWNVSVIMLNRGAHYSESKHLSKELNSMLWALRKAFPKLIVLFRSAQGGHPKCWLRDGPFARMKELQSMRDFQNGWAAIWNQRWLMKSIAERHEAIFLDVWKMTGLRPDGHVGVEGAKKDCLHYCNPGPVDAWVQMTHNALVALTGS